MMSKPEPVDEAPRADVPEDEQHQEEQPVGERQPSKWIPFMDQVAACMAIEHPISESGPIQTMDPAEACIEGARSESDAVCTGRSNKARRTHVSSVFGAFQMTPDDAGPHPFPARLQDTDTLVPAVACTPKCFMCNSECTVPKTWRYTVDTNGVKSYVLHKGIVSYCEKCNIIQVSDDVGIPFCIASI